MLKVGAQPGQAQQQIENQRGQRTGATQGGYIAQLEMMADSSPVVAAQRKLADMIHNSPHAAAQRKLADMIHNSPRQVAQQKSFERMRNSPAQVAQQKKLESLFGVTQRKKDEEPVLKKTAGEAVGQAAQQSALKPNQSVQLSSNKTGLPDNLKSGIESLSGVSMDNVRVHYNSSQPAQLNALAYAQGTDIHVAPGQEKHLPHEAWHVVQQAQGRVQPTTQMKGGVPVNDDAGLEHEADIMGARAMEAVQLTGGKESRLWEVSHSNHAPVAQKITEISYTQGTMTYWTGGANTRNFDVGVRADALLDPANPKTGSRTGGAPHPSPYTNGNWPALYQGHLLNANLGGQAIAQNLFPVTPAFNGLHSTIVEDRVKAELLDLRARQINPATAANYDNRRLHYSVEVINPNIAAPFRPAHIGNTTFRCLSEYTQNNNGVGLGTGVDHTLNHGQIDVQVPAPPETLNEQLDALGWGPDVAPTYRLGVHPGGAAPANKRTVLDGALNTVPNMFIFV